MTPLDPVNRNLADLTPLWSGRVVEPQGAAIGEAAAGLLGHPALAGRLGAAGYQRVQGIGWRSAVNALLSAGGIG